MIRTRVGYTGGRTANPTYHNLGDHSETIQIDYDPSQISYKELLDIFWKSHNPQTQAWSRQYMSAVFFHNDEQKRLALETKQGEADRRNAEIFTQILPASTFYLAEDYHQKYRLRQDRDLLKELSTIYPNLEDFINSTAVTRVNGYLSGYGSSDMLQKELPNLGLSPAASKKLLDRVSRADR